jgi:hypothetical protein
MAAFQERSTVRWASEAFQCNVNGASNIHNMIASRDFLLNHGNTWNLREILGHPTKDAIIEVPTREFDIIQSDETPATVLAAGLLLTGMVAWAMEAFAWLWAAEDTM